MCSLLFFHSRRPGSRLGHAAGAAVHSEGHPRLRRDPQFVNGDRRYSMLLM
jgi:hypothetical protein